MRILIVEDDPRIALSVAEYLRRQRHVVDTVHDGATALEYARRVAYDLLLVDVALPKLDGLSLCVKIRAEKSTTPIMMLTARDAVQSKIDALDAGADDYLTKPFDLGELAARIRALGRRGAAVRASVLSHGSLSLDTATRGVQIASRPVQCTPTEFAILETLLRSPRQVFTREMLLERVRALDSDTADVAIKVHVANLRRKLSAAGAKKPVIQTLHGIGYRLAES
jgi:two-component system, OmpR family, response regulator QseB